MRSCPPSDHTWRTYAWVTKVYKPALTAAVSGVVADYRGQRGSVAPGVLNSIFHPSLEPLVELHTELLVRLEVA